MSRAVRFDAYGDVDVLYVADVPAPVPGPGQVVVQMHAAGINPGEVGIRTGALHDRWPANFPSGQGSDLAGVVTAVGDDVVDWAAGDEVVGFTHARASHAELVVVEGGNIVSKPPGVSWEVAGGLFVAGTTAWAAVRAVAPQAGDVVVIAGGAGGVGLVAVQLAARAGATVIALASERNHDWLRAHGAVPVAYGDGVRDRITAAAPGGVDAFIDAFGHGYVDLAIELGVAADRIDTIADMAAVERHGVKSDGTAVAANAAVLSELVGLLASGDLELPIAAAYPLDRVRDAYRALAGAHPLGKIVLVP